MLTPFQYSTIGLALALLVMTGLWQIERGDRQLAEAREASEIQKRQIVEGALTTQTNAFATFDRMEVANAARLLTSEAALKQANANTEEIRNEITNLRASEEAAAIADPFSRGNAARLRMCRIVQRVDADGNVPGCDNPQADAADDP